MIQYKVMFDDRSMTSWKINNYSTMEYVSLIGFSPVHHRLFNGDIFTFAENDVCTIIHSPIRETQGMPGVLVLEGGKMYGKEKNKCLYKCLPDDKRIPPFTIPYEIRSLGFSKKAVNKYVNFKFISWNSNHPLGMLTQTIGDVDIIENFYEYQLYCKSLNASIQNFTKSTARNFKALTNDPSKVLDSIVESNPQIVDRTHENIFTIDGKGTQDFDDAVSFTPINKTKHKVSIYIANVCVWIDTLNLWESFANRISTIYLPDRKRPMLPTILSDILCSLQQGERRIVFAMDLIVENGEITDIDFVNCVISVRKNYIYEEKALVNMSDYQSLLSTTRNMIKKHKFVRVIKNSYDVIAYLMICMNYYCAKHFCDHDNGIYRSSSFHNTTAPVPSTLPDDVYNFMKIWGAAAGQYVVGKTPHEILELDTYTHITSPIRRLVDLLNLTNIQRNLGMYVFKGDIDRFYTYWLGKLDYINTTMRSIRKVQTECSLLELCTKTPNMSETEYTGYVFDRIERNDGLYQYMSYLPELKMVSKINSRLNKNNFDSVLFRIYLFRDEDRLKQKIRVHMLE